jgi:hypothetical protein
LLNREPKRERERERERERDLHVMRLRFKPRSQVTKSLKDITSRSVEREHLVG